MTVTQDTCSDISPSVLARAFKVLDSMPDDGSGITLTELAAATQVPKGSLHRMLGQLLALDVLRRDGDLYLLGRHLFRLTRRTDPDIRLREAALPHMIELQAQTRQTVHLGVLDGPEVLYVERVGSQSPARLPTRIGQRMPAYCTGLGKALLAFAPDTSTLDRVLASGLPRRTPRTLSMPGIFLRELQRSQSCGFAQDREESLVGVSCIAMPVPGPRGPVAAVSISSPVERGDGSAPRHLRLLQSATQQISRSLRAEPIPA